MDICVCTIYDGSQFHLGISAAFEPPPAITNCMLEDRLNMTDACFRLGLTNKTDIGSQEGMIGILTRGRMDRKACTKQAIISALIHLENSDWYGN